MGLLYTNIHEDFSVTKSLAPLWKNEVFHTAIEYSLVVHNNSRPNDIEYEETFDFQSADYNLIKNKLRDINWQNALRDEENVETAVETFYEKLFEIITDEVPLKRKDANLILNTQFGTTKNYKSKKTAIKRPMKHINIIKLSQHLRFIEL